MKEVLVPLACGWPAGKRQAARAQAAPRKPHITMRHSTLAPVLAAMTLLGSLACAPPGVCDPLHKVGRDGAWRHEGSGWIFPRQTDGLERVGAPYSLDGTDDVGAEYAGNRDGVRIVIKIDVYSADSAASSATLSGARAAFFGLGTGQSSSGPATSGDASGLSSVPFPLQQRPDLNGLRLSHLASVGASDTRSALYFIQAPAWVVSVRATCNGTDISNDGMLDELVRALPWDTLGTDAGNLHGNGT